MKFPKAGQAELIEIPAPVPGQGEVVIRVKAAGICASDVAAFQGKHDVRRPPIITGHELAGEIIEVGAGVLTRSAGERVGVEPHLGCGRCPYCRQGHSHECLERRSLGVGDWTGAFAEYVVVAERMCHVLPESMPWEEAAALEPLCVGLHAVGRACLRPGETVSIVGVGTIGLMTLLGVNCHAPGWVAATDPNPVKRRAALRCGADMVVDPLQEDPVKAVQAATGGLGTDVVFLAVSSDAALRQALEMCRRIGRVVVIASFFTGGVELRQVVARERTILGSFAFTGEDYTLALRLWERGGFRQLPSLITERIRLEDAPEVVAALARGEKLDSIKTVIIFH